MWSKLKDLLSDLANDRQIDLVIRRHRQALQRKQRMRLEKSAG